MTQPFSGDPAANPQQTGRDTAAGDQPVYAYPEGYNPTAAPFGAPAQPNPYAAYQNVPVKKNNTGVLVILGIVAVMVAGTVWTFMSFDEDRELYGGERGSSGSLVDGIPGVVGSISPPSYSAGEPYVVIDGVPYWKLPTAPDPDEDLTRVDWGHPRLDVVSRYGYEDEFDDDIRACLKKDTVTPSALRCVYSKGHSVLVYTVDKAGK